MSKEIMYQCINRNGPDGACEYAENKELIPASKVVEKDEDGNPLCPGKTVFGDPCGAILEPAGKGPGEDGKIWKKIALIAAIVVGVAILGYVVRKLIIPPGHAKLRIENTSLSLTPGESAKIELFNDGDGTLKIKKSEFSSNAFSLESAGELPEVEPGESGSLRIQLAPEVNDNVQSTLTLYTNGSETPVTIDLSANVDPWDVFQRLSRNSKILKQE